MTPGQLARLAALEARLSAAERQLQPQTMRQRLERTVDPRGGEPRIIDEDGRTLDYAPAIQFAGQLTAELDAAAQRIVVTGNTPTPGEFSTLVWADDFAADQLATAYTDVANFTVSSGSLVSAAGAVTSTAKPSAVALHGCLQTIKVTSPAAVPANGSHFIRLGARLRGTNLLVADWTMRDGSGTQGVLSVTSEAGGVVAADAESAYLMPVSSSRWFTFGVAGAHCFAGISTVSPADAAFDPTCVFGTQTSLATNNWLASPGPTGVWHFNVAGSASWTFDEYRVWLI